MKITEFWSTYCGWVEFVKLKYPPTAWVMISLGITLLIGGGTFFVSYLLIKQLTMLPLAFGLAAAVLTIGYPYMKKQSIIESIEKNLGDALKQMADTLKAGDTYESALREVAESDYGRLSEEMANALRRLEDGETLENSLIVFSKRIDSKVVKRSITIILDSIKTGASLADILEEISDDVRDFQRLKSERKAETTMQFLFMLVAGGIIAPAIFGEINAVIGGFGFIGNQTLSEQQLIDSAALNALVVALIQLYIIIEVVGAGIMMSLIRAGSLSKSIIYIPMLLLLAFISFYASYFIIFSMLAGAMA